MVLAVSAATQQRVRPILMTTTTTVAGLVPLVLFPGSGSELYRGIGAVVLGGLVFSTVLTLFVVPAFFSLLARMRSPVPPPEPAAPSPMAGRAD
jgi:HAE1 family hydrophobic/amphiphilic exporter-1